MKKTDKLMKEVAKRCDCYCPSKRSKSTNSTSQSSTSCQNCTHYNHEVVCDLDLYEKIADRNDLM